MKNAGIISGNGTINAVINGAQYTLPSESKFYQQALAAFKTENWDGVAEACDFDKKLRQNSDGKVTCENGEIRYNGAIVSNKLSDRILRMLDEGFRCQSLINFLELCLQNPNRTVVDRLYDFLECASIMLDEEGYIVGYKGVRETGYDWYSNTVLYEVGKTTEMPRGQCDEDSRNTCSSSLHLANRVFAEGWVRGGKLLLCRTSPEDVTAVPEESGAPKLRTCRVEVLQEITAQDSFKATVYSSNKHDALFPQTGRDSNGRFVLGNKVSQQRDSLGRFSR